MPLGGICYCNIPYEYDHMIFQKRNISLDVVFNRFIIHRTRYFKTNNLLNITLRNIFHFWYTKMFHQMSTVEIINGTITWLLKYSFKVVWSMKLWTTVAKIYEKLKIFNWGACNSHNISTNIMFYLVNQRLRFWPHVRGRSDKYLASPPEGATIVREIYHRIVYSRRLLL